MKKKLLFVTGNLAAGGAEKSLISLLSSLDYERVEADLLLFDRQGLFLPLLPPQVRLLPDYGQAHLLFVNRKRIGSDLMQTLRKEGLALFFTAAAGVLGIFMGGKMAARQWLWEKTKKHFTTLSGYDAAISYLEGMPVRFVADCTDAPLKISWFHSDYIRAGHNPALDLPYLERFDKIVTVSQLCAQSMKQAMPSLEDRIDVIENLLSPALIRVMAETGKRLPPFEGLNLLTVGRLSTEKGMDIALEAMRLLKSEGMALRWYLLGDGPEKSKLIALIGRYHLEDSFVLLGTDANPYGYIQSADIYVQPSRYEGKSIAVDEAKVLNRPVIVTNFSTASDQIENGVTGLIANMTPEGLACEVKRLLSDPGLRHRLSEKLMQIDFSNLGELDKLYGWLNS